MKIAAMQILLLLNFTGYFTDNLGYSNILGGAWERAFSLRQKPMKTFATPRLSIIMH